MAIRQEPLQRQPGYVSAQNISHASFKALYALHHSRRFRWLRRKIISSGKTRLSILELGCNDATSLDYVPVAIDRYVGFDAGWQSGRKDGVAYGLEAARQRYAGIEGIEFHRSNDYRDILALSGTFDFAFVLETFEYLDPSKLESYISALADKAWPSGQLVSTMPNEKGIAVLLKHLGSRISGVRRSQYSPWELALAALGRVRSIPRSARGRKGFDYQRIAELAQKHFQYVRLEPVEPSFLPCSMSLNIGLVASHGIIDPARTVPPTSLNYKCEAMI
ncbi:MAG TPA: class I SAM-dependent methyltransferase [Verrucomicrobiae bacterium]|nr:class I SAM-dependent methyltransferase [Verrucomicrobiae bacterium]